MSNFLEYLQSLRSFVGKLGSSTKLYLTAGNESCDMDSIACSLAHAYMLSKTVPTGAFSLPLLPCSRADLHLRQDVIWLFGELGIDPDALLYSDDISAELLSSVDELFITLVDHNSPKGLLERFKSNITEVIDHHERTESTLASGDGVKVLIESVGSCSTLVAERIFSENAEVVDEKVAAVFLASILLDTGDLKMQERVTQKDNAIAEQLLQKVASNIDREQFYTKLFEQRSDISQLTNLDVLRRDFKLERVGDTFSFGFSTVTALLSDFLRRPDIFRDLSSFYTSYSLDALLLLGVHVSSRDASEKRRQIAIFRPSSEPSISPVPHLLESLASLLEDDPDLKCDRTDGSIEGFDGVLLEQGNVAISRKQIIPKVTQFVSSVEYEKAANASNLPAAVLDAEHSAPLEPTVVVLTKPGSEGEGTPTGAVHVSYKTEVAPNIPEYSFKQEAEDLRKHRLVRIGEEEKNIDMDIVQPYRKIVQHAGYVGAKRQALLVISACYLPPHSLPNYSNVMEHVFFYVMSVLDKLVMDEYIIVYLHSGAPHNSMPSIRILHKFYKMVDRRLFPIVSVLHAEMRGAWLETKSVYFCSDFFVFYRLRKQLMHLYIVHPTFWVKAMIRLARPVISGKFWRKVRFVATLQDLSSHVSVEDSLIAAPVFAVDQVIMSRRPARRRYQQDVPTKPDQQDKDSAATATKED